MTRKPAPDRKERPAGIVIFTIGHSTRPIAEFIELLKANGVQRVIDIRTIPRSRHNPQYSREALAPALRRARIGYVHLRKLGGLRRPKLDSANAGWRNAGFRGYADYMQTLEFQTGLARAMQLAKSKTTALMCAEAVPWRCHRSLVADALTARGILVREIISRNSVRPHKLTSFARVRGTSVSYPAGHEAWRNLS